MGSASASRTGPASGVARALRACAAVVGLLACALGLAGCEPRRVPPTPLPVPAGAARVVVLSPALGVTLRDLGLKERAVGRHAYDVALPKSLAVCGDFREIDFESLIAARPTHVAVQWGSRELPPRLGDLARTNGWKVLVSEPLSLDDVERSALELGEFLGEREAGERLAGRMREAWRRREGLERAGRVVLLLSADPPAALGPGSCHQQVLERIGGVPAIAKGSPYMRLDHEDLIALKPDGIVLIMPRSERGAADESTAGTPTNGSALERLGKLRGLPIPAIEKGRAALIDGEEMLLPSSAMIGFAEELEKVLEEWSGRERKK